MINLDLDDQCGCAGLKYFRVTGELINDDLLSYGTERRPHPTNSKQETHNHVKPLGDSDR